MNVRKLAVSAMLVCLDIVFTRMLAINTPLMKIGFGFAAVALCALFYGPLWAMLTAAIGDFVGALIFPVGPFFPGFTLTAALTGLVFGLCLHKKSRSWLWPALAAGLNCLLVTLVANTAMISYISGTPFATLFALRAVQFFVMFPIQTLVLGLLCRSKLICSFADRYIG